MNEEASWEDFLSAVSSKLDHKCKVGESIAELPETVQQDISAAFTDTRISTQRIFQEMKSRGMKFGQTALRNHRQEICSCHREDSN